MGRASIWDAKTTLSYANITSAIRSPRAWYAGIVNVRNLGNSDEVNMKLNCKIKKDNFKTSIIPCQEIRLIHSSEDIG